MSLTRTHRLGALVATASLAVAGLTFAAAPAQAATDPRPVAISSGWLTGQLTGGLIHNAQYDFDDYGLTVDAGLALDEVGGNGSSVAAIDSALQSGISNYITGEAFGDAGSSYAGQLAKAAVFADAAGSNPASYGGKDLIALLEARVSSTSPISGRIEDLSTFGDNSNVLGQAFAVNALTTATSTEAASALTFLLKQQCSAGYFRLYMTTDKTAPDQTCEGGRATGDSAADPDATSTAVRMLLPQLGTSAAAARSIGKAEAWLLAQQHPDGSFNGGTSTNAPNTNSTALAGWALGLLDDDEAAAKAAVWVRMHQVDEAGTCTSAVPAGAMAYNDAALATGIGAGITDSTADQWRRAASQGLPVLQWAPDATPDLTLTAPSYYLRAGGTGPFTVSGVIPGDKVCLTGAGAPLRGTADAAGTVVLHPVMPAGTANRTVTVTDRAADTATGVAKVLGAKTLGVKAAKSRVKRRGSVTVVVSGLAPGELTKVAFRGRIVSGGKASSTGRYVATIKVGRRLGKATIRAYGQFPLIRRGATVIRVIR